MKLQSGRAHFSQLGKQGELDGYGATQPIVALPIVTQPPAKYRNQHNGLDSPPSPATLAHTAQQTPHVCAALVLPRAEYTCLDRRIT